MAQWWAEAYTGDRYKTICSAYCFQTHAPTDSLTLATIQSLGDKRDNYQRYIVVSFHSVSYCDLVLHFLLWHVGSRVYQLASSYCTTLVLKTEYSLAQ